MFGSGGDIEMIPFFGIFNQKTLAQTLSGQIQLNAATFAAVAFVTNVSYISTFIRLI